MIDAMGVAESVLIVGTPEHLTKAFVARIVSPRTQRFTVILATKDATPNEHELKLVGQLEKLSSRQGVSEHTVHSYATGDFASLESKLDDAFTTGNIDLAIVLTTSSIGRDTLVDIGPELVTANIAAASGRFAEGLMTLRKTSECLGKQGKGQLVALTDGKVDQRVPSVERAALLGIDDYANSLAKPLKKAGVRLIQARTRPKRLGQKPTTPGEFADEVSTMIIKRKPGEIKLRV